ncbi:hypothetical protein BDY17DRAFT_64424 [Neohortaea acidophila]|uniref:Uncharacterized protein n=1 Tax=Neohortaea acidophila TaxID=245834 RepID=A0A6A6PET7_9PEZI|nr:uncharacterized protein BDY17DRAFT_64424 [Neohortaea acidophila]KAF2478498.1 hypothetical protein BDY17DRAFT_64424 [Neohortaea acidophila]
MNHTAPTNSPIASSGLPEAIEAHIEKRAGPQFPDASNVTLARVSLEFRTLAMKLRFTGEKLSAHMLATAENRMDVQVGMAAERWVK